MLFTEFNFKEGVLRGLNELGYEQPTPIQEQTITAFKTGKDIVGQSQTGTGKTAAFTLPILDVIDTNLREIQALILVPTRELAVQTQEEFFNLGRYSRVRALAAYGGRSIRFQQKLMDQGMHVAVCTPGRAMDMFERKMLKPEHIKYFVLDEVDRMLDMGFIDDVEWMRNQCTNIKQTMLFSATVTSEVKDVIHRHIPADHVFIQIEPEQVVVDKIDHAFVIAPHIGKLDMLVKWIESHKDHKIIIFTQTKYKTDELEEFLYSKGYSVGLLHGDVDQRQRLATLKAYKENKMNILIATDVASRGLNMKDIDLVINFDVPQDPESYVHRIGRTARAGKSGKAIMFVSEGEMKSVQVIEKRNKIRIKKVDTEGNEVPRDDIRSRSSGRSGGRFGGSRFGGQRRSYAPRVLKDGETGGTLPTGRQVREGGTERSREGRFSERGGSRFERSERPGYAGRSRFGGPRSIDGGRREGFRFGGEDRGGSRFSSDRRSSSRSPRIPNAFEKDGGRGGYGSRRSDPRSANSLIGDLAPRSEAERPQRGNYWGKE